ncbi:hypothetical protein [Bacteroides faecis]|uniref:Uncharacterized protein n=1 Tax=Bacteroides faecis TaxID=674529 RepID=A0ABY5TFC1_9BACE|nr:hypothetical protein [Bacteroides faecis]MCS2234476.1 hypothetical protein [Bacteroides faecis]MCS2477474.1 hypothetical protein [Bacteroides faecis]MCS2548033.1 hypothetical protein [Bacteroides faecis]MCS2934897.1 hypothetical protein [Bacteroides faecis]MCS3067052.1 hypothetical protein [Bacteroides faecis]
MDLYHKYFWWGMDGVWTALQFPGSEGCLHRWRGVSSSVAKGVLIGGEGCPHRWRTISSSVAKVQVKVTCQEKRMEGQSETPV